MNEKYNALFTPWKIGNVEMKNRIVQCSMGGTSLFGWMEPNHFDKEAAYFLLNRAQDGVGLILPGMQCIKDPIGGRWLYQNNKMFKDLKEYMVEFHKTGSKLFIQLAAGMGRSMAITKPMVALLKHPILGKLASPVADLDYITASASATPNRWYDEIKSRPMTIKEIHDQVEAFAKTSKKLMDAGVDGVEIHAVHEGYLLDQFTISNMNYRTDEYGGSFENRFRFPVEIVQAIKAACGDDFPVSLRYSVVSKTKDWGKGAMPYEKDFKEFGRDMEESEKAIKYLADAGYDMFNEMMASIREDTVKMMFRVKVEKPEEREQVAKVTGTNKDDSGVKAPVRRNAPKIQPNDPCPCGSGKKYKQCCGRFAE